MCGLEFPDLETRIWQPLRDQDVVVIGVASGGLHGGDDETRVRKFIAETGVTFPVVLDHGQSVAYQTGLAISPFPTDVIVDGDGVIRGIYSEYDPDVLVDAIDQVR